MSEALKTLSPETWTVINSVISLPESVDGLLPYALPDGRTISPSGLALALASLSARQVKELGLTISGISGLHSFTSSASAALASSLASRLQVRMGLHGSTLYKLTWKVRVTPMQRSIYALRGSALPISDNGCTGWPTPTSPTNTNGHQAGNNRYVTKAVQIIKGWNTPRASDGKNGGPNQGGGALSYDATRMGSDGPLNPELSRWLMGFPSVWTSSGVTGMELSRTLARSSSLRTEKSGGKS